MRCSDLQRTSCTNERQSCGSSVGVAIKRTQYHSSSRIYIAFIEEYTQSFTVPFHGPLMDAGRNPPRECIMRGHAAIRASLPG